MQKLTQLQIRKFGKEVLHVSDSTSFILLIIMNGIGIVGRLSCGYLADRSIGALALIVPVAFLAGVFLYSWIAITSVSGLYVFVVFYGLIAAGMQTLFPAALANLTPDLHKMGTRLGMCFSIVSFACLTGPPLAGKLIQLNDGKFLFAQLFGGSALMIGSMFLLACKATKEGWWRIFKKRQQNNDLEATATNDTSNTNETEQSSTPADERKEK